ncbi:MAG: hypothetical protein IJ297_03135 [Clostridia bacterium]|nr:hypothetical protein [Clostridia bacterium]
MPGMKKAKENSLEYLKKLQEEAMAEVPSETPAEEINDEEAQADEALTQLADDVPEEETAVEESKEVPDENVENLDGSEVGGDDDTSSTAEAVPATPTGEGNVDVQALIAENKLQKEEIENLRKALEQSGELSKESVVAVAMDDFDDIDMSALVYGDESARKEIPAKLVAHVFNALRSEATPILKERDEAMHALKVQKAIKVLTAMEDMFPGFGKESDVIEALIGRDKVLASYEDPMQARIAGYLINEGLKAVEKGKAGMSVDELMDLYRKNEEFKAAIEQDRLERLKEAPQLPPMPVSSSLSTHEPYTADTPKDMDAANKSLRELRKKFLK